MDDLHISERLHQLLPPLTKEEKEQLKANIAADGQVFSPILYWHDGERNLIVDGMHRWPLVRGTDIPYTTEEMEFETIEDVELWILEHQLGSRNLLKPAAIRKLRGQLYNRLKGRQGHNLRSEERKKYQNDTSCADAAKRLAKQTGVSTATIKRDGAREEAQEALNTLTKAAQFISADMSDKDVKHLASLSPPDQDAVARAIRTGQATTLAQAAKLSGVKAPKRHRASKKPKRQLDRSGWYKQFDKSISPIVKLVDQIAREVNEMHGKHHRKVKDLMNQIGDTMAEWMQVE